jgi:predicted phosphoribosyltransferase
VVRKVGVPFQPELAMGAVGEGGASVLNQHVVTMAGVPDGTVRRVERRERAAVADQAARFRGGRSPVPVVGRTVVVVDDGVATGSSCVLACRMARARGAHRVVVAVPVAPPSSVAKLEEVADEVVVLEVPADFSAVGQFYDDFTQVSDHEVSSLLAAAPAAPGGVSGAP